LHTRAAQSVRADSSGPRDDHLRGHQILDGQKLIKHKPQAADPRVRITPLGVSRLGRPIEMISLGEGDRDALIVGVPHPNEPAGAVTVERLIALLLHSERERRGYRWHFIKAIDPEGLRLNGGWLKKPRSPGNYLENFFRPALLRQPETTFPLDLPECRFSASTPENEAWQRALELTRPVLHASLHHCEFGGVFYTLSQFELLHTQYGLFVLRTYGLLLSLANQELLARPHDAAARATRQQSMAALHEELTRLEERSRLTPVPIRVMSGLQMAAIFICADALSAN
jgi:hypothetical protein